MDYSTGQCVRVADSPRLPEALKGKLAAVDDVVTRIDGKKTYMVSLMSLQFIVSEDDLMPGPAERIH
jgi:hypothetical protein